MGARSANRTPSGGPLTLMEEAQARARAYVRSLANGDRVMLVRAEALATPATAFESNRQKLEEAIVDSEPGATALNLEQALDFARQVQSLSARRAGEIVFAGSGRVTEAEAAALSTAHVPNLRVLAVNDVPENCGLRKIGLRRSVADPAVWDIFVSVRNYGSKPRNVNLTLQFGGAPAGSRTLSLSAGTEQDALFEYRTKAAGLLEARLVTHDAFPADDRAVVELPQEKSLSVAVYSNEPELLRPMLEASPQVHAVSRKPAEYSATSDAALVVLDRFRPPARPSVDSIWIEPPSGGSPIPLRKSVTQVKLTRWHTENSLGEGLRSKDLNLDSSLVFEAAPGDIPIAEVEAGPVIVARPGKPKIVVMGFHPARSAMRYELSTPLLFANTLRWMAPDIFRRREVIGGSVGAVSMAVDPDIESAQIRVTQEDGTSLPFTLRNHTVQFFAGARRDRARDSGGSRSTTTLWCCPRCPRQSGTRPQTQCADSRQTEELGGPVDLWQALACLGMAGLLVDWVYYGRLGRTAMIRGIAGTGSFNAAVAVRSVSGPVVN